jgi:CRISPR locus-related DNA-binding protein
MTVLFGTLGWRPQSLIPSIKSTPDLERLVFYHSPHPDSLRAQNAILEYCEAMRLPARASELPDAFNLLEIARRLKEDLRREREAGHQAIRFNIAGGTRVMSSAALLVCILEGIPTTYVHDDTFEEIQLPMLQIRYATGLTKREKEILEFLLRTEGKDYSQTELAKALGVKKATINHQLKRLVAKQLVTLEVQPGDTRKRIVRLVPAVELLLG